MKKLFWHNLGRSIHIWSEIEAVFNISEFQNGRHFEIATTFFTGNYTGNWIYKKIAMSISNILSYWSTLKYWRRNINFKIWPTLWYGDVINDVMNMYSHKLSHNLMILMQRKFNDDIFARFLVIIKNVAILFKKEYIGPNSRPPCDVIDDVIIMKNTFLGIIWDDLFISEVKLKLCLIFRNFINGRHFWARDKLFHRKLHRKLNMSER